MTKVLRQPPDYRSNWQPLDTALVFLRRRPRHSQGFDSWDAIAVLALVFFAAALGIATLLLRPDLHAGAADVLFSDAGYNLLVVDRLLEGARLYGDIAFQYGPFPIYLHAAVASVLGNTLRTFHLLLLTISLVNVALAYTLIRSCASRLTATVVVALGLSASMLIPGSLLGAFSVSSYVPLERTVLLLAALAWVPPASRSVRRGVLLGLAIGAWQGVRFGGGVFLGVAVVLADLLALWWTGELRRVPLLRWMRLLLWTAGAAMLVEVVLAAVALSTLPRSVAWDFIWPSYVLGSYSAWMTPDLRWPNLGEPKLLIGQYLSPLLGAAVGLVALVWYLGRRTKVGQEGAQSGAPEQIRLLIPFFFYVLAAALFFRMAFHFLQFAWLLVIPLAWGFERGSRLTRTALVALLLPCFALNVRTIFSNPVPAELGVIRTRAGEELWASREGREEIATLVHALREDSGPAGNGRRGAVLVVPLGAGLYHQYGFDNDLRQPWFLGTFHRPYDERPLLASLDQTRSVVFRTKGSQTAHDPCSGDLRLSLSRAACAQLAERLVDPQRVGSFWVYGVR